VADFDEEFDFDDDDSLSGTDLVKKLRKQIAQQNRLLKEREQELAELAVSTRDQTIGSWLEEFGLTPRIARYVPDDVDSIDALEEWLVEEGEVFGIYPDEGGELDIDEESVRAAELMSAVEDGGFDPDVGRDLEDRIKNAKTQEELMALLRG